MKSLQHKITVVTGATRKHNGGWGIARVLGEAGATVYVTGRSRRGYPTTTGEPDHTIENTAEMVGERGGTGIPVRCDHTDDAQVAALFERIRNEHGRLALLINNAWGGYEMQEGFSDTRPFWELPLEQWTLMHDAGLRSHMLTARMAMPLLLSHGRGLIVNTTTGIHPLGKYYNHLFYDTVKVAINRMSYGMAQDCRPYGVAVVGLSLGDDTQYMRTWGVDLNEISPDEPTFSTDYVGRAVVAMATDPNIMDKSGCLPFLTVPELAREYGFTDIDGRQP